MKNLIVRWLKIYEDEIELFFWMALLLLFISSSNIVLSNFVETAFLKRFGVQYLPAITAINAVVTFFLLGSLGGILARVRNDRMIVRSLIVCGLFVGLLRFAIPLGQDLIYPLLYVLKTQIDVLLTFLFWNLANDLFSTRQSKRLFPLITAGGIVGGIVGSFGTPLIARLVSLDNLLLVFPLLTLIAAMCAWRLGVVIPGGSLWEQSNKESGKKPILEEFQSVFPLIRTSTLAQVLFLLALLPNIVIPILNYQFNFVIDQTFGNESGMLNFYSYFRGAQNTLSLLLVLFVGRIYGRFGLPAALMFHPLNYLLAFSAYLFQFNIFSAIYAGTSVGVIRRTINGPASAALYGLLLPKDRTMLRSFLRGTVVRCGILVGSAIVWIGGGAMHPRYLSLLALGFVLAWLAGTFLLKRRYSQILFDIVRGKLPDFYRMSKRDLRELFHGVKVGPVLLGRLRESTGDETLWYADLLHKNRVSGLDEVILKKLPELDDATRIRLLPYLSEQKGEQVMSVFRQLVDPARPELLVALARTARRFAAGIPPAMEKDIFDQSDDPEVKACFLGWLQEKDPDGLVRLVERWLGSENLVERRAAILAIRERGLIAYAKTVCRFLEVEKAPSLICPALRALPELNISERAEIASRFVRHADQGVRLAAVDALPLETEASVRVLIPVMGDPADEVRQRAIQRLGEIANPLHPLLVGAMGTYSRRVLEGLFQVMQLLEISELDLVRFCRKELKVACQALDLADWLTRTPATVGRDLLLIHLEEVRKQRTENVLHGLSARDSSGQLETILHGLHATAAREKGDSLEALDSLLDPRLARILLPYLENRSPAEQLAVGKRYLRHLDLAKSERKALEKLLQNENDACVILTLELLVEWGRVNEFRSMIEALAVIENELVSTFAIGILQESQEQNMDIEKSQMGLPERVLHLRRIDLFQDLQINELTAIALVADETIFPPNTLILGSELPCRSGERSCECLHILVSGEVVVESNSLTRDVPLARWGEGQSFGISALFGMSHAPLNVRTIKESLVIRIYRQDFSAIIKEYPEIALRMCQVLAGRLGGAFDELSRLATEHANGAEVEQQCGVESEADGCLAHKEQG